MIKRLHDQLLHECELQRFANECEIGALRRVGHAAYNQVVVDSHALIR